MRSWVHRVLKEDLGEKVTEAEWTLLWLAAETEDRARRHEPEATARADGHEVADAPGEDNSEGYGVGVVLERTCARPGRDQGVT